MKAIKNRIYPLPNDPCFPSMAEAMDPEVMKAILQEKLSGSQKGNDFELTECMPDYFRYKPRVSCIIGYSLHISDNGCASERTQRVYGRFIGSREARTTIGKALKTHTANPVFGPPMVYLESVGMLLSFFPNDRCLRGLRFALDPDKLKRIAQRKLHHLLSDDWRIRGRKSTLNILSYKPERHCVVRCQLGLKNGTTGEKKKLTVITKLLRPEKGNVLCQANQQLWELFREAGRSQIIPRPLAFDSSFSLFFQENIEGRHPLLHVTHPAMRDEVLREITERLRSLHEAPLQKIRHYTPENELEDLKESVLETVKVLPDEEDKLLEQLNCIDQHYFHLIGRPLQTVHGDFHIEQVMIGETGPVILDLDEIRASDPLTDVANFTAHLLKYEMEGCCSRNEVEQAEQAFLRSYFDRGEFPAVKSVYLWHKKVALVKLALSNLKFLRPDWRKKMDYFLGEAQKLGS